jgi:hypothetical protein
MACAKASVDSFRMSHFVVIAGILFIIASRITKIPARKEFFSDVGIIMIAVSCLFWIFGGF